MTAQLPLLPAAVAKSAVLSPCELYRYVLTRVWSPGPLLLYLLVNPSKADHEDDDPSVRSMTRIAKALDAGGFIVVNLFAFRSPEVTDLITAADPIGPQNDAWIDKEVRVATTIIAGWGSKSGRVGKLIEARAEAVLARVTTTKSVHALRLTKDGSPEHPLFLKSDIKPVLFRSRGSPTPPTRP